MILHQYNTSTYLEDRIEAFWNLYKVKILELNTRAWKEEDLRGESLTQWSIMQYYNVLSLVILIYLDIKKNNTIYPTWSYYNTKYDLDNKKKCLACNNIDLDKILNIFDLPFTSIGEGIGAMEIETNLEIN